MKRFSILVVLTIMIFAGCNEANAQQMTMTTAKEGLVFIALAGTGTAIVDWGYGTQNDTVVIISSNENFPTVFRHEYIVSTPRTITIIGNNITHFSCDHNYLITLDISNNTALEFLERSSNQLTSLDVSRNIDLKFLDCSNNRLNSLDVSNNTALGLLNCGSNQLTVLDISKNTNLQSLFCYDNKLTVLDVSNNTAMTWIEIEYNQFSATALNATFRTLYRENNIERQKKEIRITGNPGVSTCIRLFAKRRGWNVHNFKY